MIDQRKLDTILLAAKVKAREILANYHLFMSAERSNYYGEGGGRWEPEEPEGQSEDAGGEVQEPVAEIAGQIYS